MDDKTRFDQSEPPREAKVTVEIHQHVQAAQPVVTFAELVSERSNLLLALESNAKDALELGFDTAKLQNASVEAVKYHNAHGFALENQ